MRKEKTLAILIALIAGLALMAAPAAAESLFIGGGVAQSFSFAMNATDTGMPTMHIGTNDQTLINTVTLSSNTGWNIKARDSMPAGSPAGSEGKMKLFNPSRQYADGIFLQNPMQMSITPGANGYVSLSGADQVLRSGTLGAAFTEPIKLRQVITATDPASDGIANWYQLIVIVTGSAA